MTIAAYEILCRVFGSIDWCMSIIYHLYSLRVHRLLSCNKATYFSGFVTLFFDTVSIPPLLSRCSASLSTDPLFSFRSLSSARDKTIKTAGYLLTASAGGRGGGRRFFERSKRKIKQRLCTGLCSAWILIKKVLIWASLYRFWIRNLKWIRCLVNSQCFVV